MKSVIAILLFSLLSAAIGCYFWLSQAPSTHPIYFAKVVFGKEITPETTKLFMTQGRDVFLDKNGDQLPQSNEKISNNASVEINSNANEQFEITLVDLGVNPELVSDSRPQKLILYVNSIDGHSFQMTGQLEMRAHADSKEYLHFGGPLSFLALEPNALKPRSDSKQDLKIYLGTMAQEKATATVVAPNKNPPFPTAKIKFDDEPDISMVMDYFC